MARTAGPIEPDTAPDADLEPARPFSWTTVGVFGGVTLYAYYLWLWLIAGQPVGGAILLGPLILGIAAPVITRVNRSRPDFDLGGLLLCGVVLRFAFVYYRFVHATDAWGYHVDGLRLSEFYRQLNFSAPTGGTVPGTGGMNAVSAVVEIFVNGDFFAAFLVLTLLSTTGCWLLYRAFEIAVTDGDRYRYARLVLLWPSMCFWPASLGKDAWMVFTVGVAAYGGARIFQRLVGGYTLFTLGLLGGSFVRPHLALLALVAFFTALVIGRRRGGAATMTPGFLAKIVGVALILVIGSVLITRTQRLLDIQDFSASSLDSASARVTDQTTVGNAVFHAANPRSPVGFVKATVTVLFRPFPTEARGSEGRLSAAEGLVLVVLTVMSFRRLRTIPRRLRAQPYVMFALSFVLLWILAFGIIANFGILARERTQMLPFYFVLLSVTSVVAKPTVGRAVAEPSTRR